MKPKIVLYGAGGHGKVVADIIEKQGRYELVGYIDDSHSADFCGYPILGGEPKLRDLREDGVEFGIATIGDAEIREMCDDRLLPAGLCLGVAVHPSAQIAKCVRLGEGSVVMPGSVLGPDTTVGRSCIVNTNAAVDHDSELAEEDRLTIMSGGAGDGGKSAA